MHLSFQKINTYSRCGLQYYFRYVEGKIVPPTSGMVVGKALHKSIEVFYKEKRKVEENPHVELLLSVYCDELDRDFSEEIFLEDDEVEKGKERVKSEYKDSGVRMLKLYHIRRAVHIQPWLVEEEFVTSLEDVAKRLGLPYEEFRGVYLRGYVDLVSGSNVIDHKTRKSTPSKDEADRSQQLTIYALGYRELFGILPEKVVLETLVFPVNKSSMGQIITLESVRSENDVNRLMKRILRIVEGIRKGVFVPPDQGSWACKYCGYRKVGICDEYVI